MEGVEALLDALRAEGAQAAAAAQAAATARAVAAAGLTARVVRDEDLDATAVVGTAAG